MVAHKRKKILRTVAEDHPELFHYTTASGLAGIVQSQTLWATHYAYLNDSEEMKYFHKDRLPNLLLQKLVKKFPKQKKIIKAFVKKALAEQLNVLYNSQEGKEPLAEPYITSFCTTKGLSAKVNKDGLLSQWRGYGRDGGYAIVFDTACLSRLLEETGKKWKNDIFFGDVVYSDASERALYRDTGFKDDLDVICKLFSDHVEENENPEIIEKSFYAIMECACRYKHWGFKEENEVRIIVIPNNKEDREFLRTDGTMVHEIPRKHYLRSSMLVPYIELFEGVTLATKKLLPIRRIIVGPVTDSQERSKKVRAVEMLLEQHGINAHVSASEIPFTG